MFVSPGAGVGSGGSWAGITCGAGGAPGAELAELTEAVLEDFRDDIEERDLRLEQELEPAWVAGDPTLLETVIANLVQNGVRYNRGGGLLRVSLQTSGPCARLELTSDGERIPEHETQALFEPFRTLERSHSRALGGAGLGLAIVKAAVAAHSGEVTLSARAEGGVSVAINLPLAASASGRARLIATAP